MEIKIVKTTAPKAKPADESKLGFGKASHLRGRQVDALAEACGGGKHLIWRYLLHWQSLYNF